MILLSYRKTGHLYRNIRHKKGGAIVPAQSTDLPDLPEKGADEPVSSPYPKRIFPQQKRLSVSKESFQPPIWTCTS
jgi:hypothetical protein